VREEVKALYAAANEVLGIESENFAPAKASVVA
jgi:hypothetical protein